MFVFNKNTPHRKIDGSIWKNWIKTLNYRLQFKHLWDHYRSCQRNSDICGCFQESNAKRIHNFLHTKHAFTNEYQFGNFKKTPFFTGISLVHRTFVLCFSIECFSLRLVGSSIALVRQFPQDHVNTEVISKLGKCCYYFNTLSKPDITYSHIVLSIINSNDSNDSNCKIFVQQSPVLDQKPPIQNCYLLISCNKGTEM